MPKIIENVREMLLEEAAKQVRERGYAGTTIRSVALECGIAVGTVYNYFESKDMLIAAYMMRDWRGFLDTIDSHSAADAEEHMRLIYRCLKEYTELNQPLFRDAEAEKVYATYHPRYHMHLRSQLSERILPLTRDGDVFVADFIAEALLAWSAEGVSFEQLYAVIRKLI